MAATLLFKSDLLKQAQVLNHQNLSRYSALKQDYTARLHWHILAVYKSFMV